MVAENLKMNFYFFFACEKIKTALLSSWIAVKLLSWKGDSEVKRDARKPRFAAGLCDCWSFQKKVSIVPHF